MPIPFTCPYCSRYTSVADEFAGRTGPCGGCGAPVMIPAIDTLNPYQSPASNLVPVDASAQLRGGLAWILFSFEGRIPRRIWWIVSILEYVLVNSVFVFFAILTETGQIQPPPDKYLAAVMLLAAIASSPLIWITLAVASKRFHDRDKSGWWYLVSLLPFIIGPLWILIECGCLRGTYGPNTYGPDPT